MMLSRVASNFYWFGRHIERVESTARLVLTYSDLVLDLPLSSRADWYQLVEITGASEQYEALRDSHGETDVISFLIDDPKNPGSIRSTLNSARENLRTTRDRVAREVAEAVNNLRDLINADGAGCANHRSARNKFLRSVIDQCEVVRGHITGSMSRSEAYRFIKFGRLLEQADMTTRLMDVRVDDLLPDDMANLPAFDALQWMSVLRSLSGYQMYRREVRGRVRGLDVIEFLFHSETFPRSVQFSLEAANRCLTYLPRPEPVQAAISELLESVLAMRASQLAKDGHALRGAIDRVQAQIGDIHGVFAQTYFSPQTDEKNVQVQTQLQV